MVLRLLSPQQHVPQDILAGKARPTRKTNKLFAIYGPIFYTMWDPQHLTILSASTACYRDSFTFLYVDDVLTSLETRPVTGRALLFLYVNDVRTSQEALLLTYTACYKDTFSLLVPLQNTSLISTRSF
jgi:uncharacterized membrane protein